MSYLDIFYQPYLILMGWDFHTDYNPIWLSIHHIIFITLTHPSPLCPQTTRSKLFVTPNA